MIHKYKALLSGVAAGTVVLAACSSSSQPKSTASTGQPSSATVAAPTGAAIKIGVISTDTNSAGNDQDVPKTIDLWQKYVNSHGGISGHAVDVIEMNDQDTPATAVQDYEALKQDGVVVIGDASYVDTAFEKQADADHIPVVALTANQISPVYLSDANFFSSETPAEYGVWGYAKAASLSGDTKMGVLYCAEASECAILPKLEQGYGATLGVTVPYSASFSASSPNYTAQCIAAKQAGANSLVVAGVDPTSNIRVLDDCAQQGYYPLNDAGGGATGSALVTDKNIKESIIISGVLPWFVRNSSTARLHAALDSFLPHSLSPLNVESTWVGLEEIREAAQNGVTSSAVPTIQDIYMGLYSFNGNTIGGLTAALTFTQGKVTNPKCEFIFALKNGSYSTPYGLSDFCQA